MIDAAELHRLYPPQTDDEPSIPSNGQPRTSELTELRARLTDKDSVIEDLRRRLDIATAQLGEALAQVRLLTDQRQPGRRWWRFGR